MRLSFLSLGMRDSDQVLEMNYISSLYKRFLW
jgi:hypothetical protein